MTSIKSAPTPTPVFRAILPLLLTTIITIHPALASAYQITFEGEDTSFNVRQGTWFLDKTSSYNGNYRFSVPGPGTGQNILDWDIDGIPGGTYRVDFYADNGDYPANAEFIVEDANGTTPFTRSLRNLTTGWHLLGTFNFSNGTGRITQTDNWTGPGTKLIADALRLTYIGTEPVPETNFLFPPAVTIVVDDLGTYDPANPSSPTGRLFANAPDLTYAVMPFEPYTISTLAYAQAHDIKTILHQPMQYYGLADSGANSDITRLYVNLPQATNLQRLRNNLINVAPYVAGINNHQGSLYTSFTPGMTMVIDELKAQGLYFLDSRTISDAVGYNIAKQKGTLTAERDLFVDGNTAQQTEDLILRVATQAKFQPNLNYIMICHQGTPTINGIISAQPKLAAMGVALKPMERNLHYIMEVDQLPPGAAIQLDGSWTSSTRDMISHELHNGEALITTQPGSAVTFTPNVPKDGQYAIFIANPTPYTNLAPVQITHAGGTDTGTVGNQVYSWRYLGRYPLRAGTSNSIKITHTAGPNMELAADAIKLIFDAPADYSSVKSWHLYK